MEHYYPSIQNVNLWFTMFRHMLYTARFFDDPKDKSWIIEELARSPDPIIALYAKLETRIGPPVARLRRRVYKSGVGSKLFNTQRKKGGMCDRSRYATLR